MNLRDLQYLVAVDDMRNFSKAADFCHVSQPTLSGQIKKIEEWLDVAIFERTNKRVMPTEVGEIILRSARAILREVDAIRDAAEHAHDPCAGKFRLGAFPTLSTYIFPKLVPLITEAMPKLRLILSEEKTAILVEKLKHGELDAAFLALPIYDDQLEAQSLFEDIFYLAVSSGHPLASHQEIDLSVLSGHKLLLLEEGHCLRDQALEVCQRQGGGEEQDFRATGLETLRQMVKAGTGITLMPKIAISQIESDIRYIPFKSPPSRTIGLVWRKTSARKLAMHTVSGLFQNI